ncbi:hypothetical protein ES703_85817 [subsurface metagenome]
MTKEKRKRGVRYGFTPLEVPTINRASRSGTVLLTGFTMVELMAMLIIIGPPASLRDLPGTLLFDSLHRFLLSRRTKHKQHCNYC